MTPSQADGVLKSVINPWYEFWKEWDVNRNHNLAAGKELLVYLYNKPLLIIRVTKGLLSTKIIFTLSFCQENSIRLKQKNRAN